MTARRNATVATLARHLTARGWAGQFDIDPAPGEPGALLLVATGPEWWHDLHTIGGVLRDIGYEVTESEHADASLVRWATPDQRRAHRRTRARAALRVLDVLIPDPPQ